MKRISIICLVVAAFLLAVVSMALAAFWTGWRGSGGWGMGAGCQRMYDPATVATVVGTVGSVGKNHAHEGDALGLHLLVKTDRETVDVHLGPDRYIERLDTKIQKGDQIEEKGSRVTIAEKPAIIAAEVKKAITSWSCGTAAGSPPGQDGEGSMGREALRRAGAGLLNTLWAFVTAV